MEEKAAALRDMRICRFCLTDKYALSNIYEKENSKNSIPLPLQIMACVTIEVCVHNSYLFDLHLLFFSLQFVKQLPLGCYKT